MRENSGTYFTHESGDSIGNKSVISLAVAPLSVLPEFQKQGIGGSCFGKHKRASQLGYSSPVLLGHKD